MPTRGLFLLQTIGLLAVLATATPANAAEPTQTEVRTSIATSNSENAKILFLRGDYRGALTEYTAAYELTKISDLLFNMAICADRLGDTQTAIRYLQQYLSQNPNDSEAQQRLKLLLPTTVPVARKPRSLPIGLAIGSGAALVLAGGLGLLARDTQSQYSEAGANGLAFSSVAGLRERYQMSTAFGWCFLSVGLVGVAVDVALWRQRK